MFGLRPLYYSTLAAVTAAVFVASHGARADELTAARFCPDPFTQDRLNKWKPEKIDKAIHLKDVSNGEVLSTVRLHQNFIMGRPAPTLFSSYVTYSPVGTQTTSAGYTLNVQKVNEPILQLPVIEFNISGKSFTLKLEDEGMGIRNSQTNMGIGILYSSAADRIYRYKMPVAMVDALADSNPATPVQSTNRFHLAYPAFPKGVECTLYLYPKEFEMLRTGVRNYSPERKNKD